MIFTNIKTVKKCTVLQKVALWARAQADSTEKKNKSNQLETSKSKLLEAFYLHQSSLQNMVTQFKEKNQSLPYETSNLTEQLEIPQLYLRSVSISHPDGFGLLDVIYQVYKNSSVLE